MKQQLQRFSLVAISIFFAAPIAKAQVAINLGAEEVYDDNIFLESDNGQFVTNSPSPVNPPINNDGHKDDDMITHVYAGASGALPLSPKVKAGAEGKIGAFVFADQEDESRMTLDTAVKIESQPTLIPDPFFATVSSQIVSGSTNVAVAEGSAARQSETHVGMIQAGVRKYQLGARTDLAADYALSRHDFLGEFNFSDRSNRPDEQGSDFWSHRIEVIPTYNVNEKLSIFNTDSLEYLDFTSISTNDLDNKTSDDLDRYQGNVGVGANYILSEKFQVGATVGVDHSRLKNDPIAQMVTIINQNGTPETITVNPGRSETSFAYSGHLDFFPDKASSLRGLVSQSNSIDIDGDRLTVRSYALNATHEFNDRVNLLLGGRYVQFANGDSLSQATDRVELSAAVSYALNTAMNLVVGWNYSDQNADSGSSNQAAINSNDYTSNRAFVGISGGFVGLKK